MKNRNIKVFFTPKQVNTKVDQSYSKSPLKPKLVIENLTSVGIADRFDIDGDFKPFKKVDFKVAHTRNYVDSFFSGRGSLATSNSLPWTPELASSVKYTNASLYNAIKFANENPETITFSPTSGFHHAGPQRGSGFCTFSGQVIASVKLYREKGLKGCYLDLDGHFGNSIEDSRYYVKDLNNAIPKGFNINPIGSDGSYTRDLENHLDRLEKAITKGDIDYVVWCHGADSHADDDLGHQCRTEYWLECSWMFYSWLNKVENKLGRSIPVTLALFGGYRKDDYQSVINLHTMDLGLCLDILTGSNLNLDLPVAEKPKASSNWDPSRWESRRSQKA